METTSLENKYFIVSYEKELADSKRLIDKIKEESWVNSDTIIVNCFPEYSSRLCQLVNHKLSYLNRNELFEVIDLAMPYPNMAQVWDPEERAYKLYIKYLSDWTRKNINDVYKYLFIGLDAIGSNFMRLKTCLRPKLEPEHCRFASLYAEKDGTFLPDFFIEAYDKSKELLFEWENMNNPNWKI